jgi:hypothetical protein
MTKSASGRLNLQWSLRLMADDHISFLFLCFTTLFVADPLSGRLENSLGESIIKIES